MTDAARPLAAPKDGTYYCFDEWDNVTGAESRFVEMFEHRPMFVWVEARMLWMGPIDRTGSNRTNWKED